MWNGRCRYHGGLLRGPVTPEGHARKLKAMQDGYRRHIERRWQRKLAGDDTAFAYNARWKKRPAPPPVEPRPPVTVWSEEAELAELAAAPIEEKLRRARLAMDVLREWARRRSA
jgi:hypothetical protein